MHGDELGVTRHFAGEEYDGNEDEQRTEHIHIVGQERYIIIVDDLAQRDLVFEEIVHFLRQVKHDGDRKNEHDREKERAQELLYYIPVEAFHANLQFIIYILVVIAGMTLSFHALKSPAMICWRACVTRSR